MLLARNVVRLLRLFANIVASGSVIPQSLVLSPLSQPMEKASVYVSTTTENTITYHNALCLSPQKFAILRS